MKIKKENILFILLFSIAVCLIFPGILLLKTAFLRGDYLQQLYPWSGLYAESLKGFRLPLWIRGVQCGFPLFAEGQIGQIYPLNLLFFFALPFRAAYNYSFLFHFILCGIFTYLLARKKGACPWGGALSAVLICFGSGYAGCFIHIAALRALTWFPLALLLYDIYLDKGKRGSLIFLIGLIAGMQLLSGSTQMAVYSIFFYCIYFLYRNGQERRSLFSYAGDILVVAFISFLIALPQLKETLVLTQHSNRQSLMTLDFALWNSFTPLGLAGSIMPYMGKLFSKGDIIYVGVMGLFFALISVWQAGEDKGVRPFILLLAVSVFMALGKYNPVYVFLLKTFKFYSFRAPARFVYFGVFAFSVLAGTGFSFFLRHKERISSSVYNIFSAVLFFAIGSWLAAKAVFALYGPRILDLAKEYVRNNIYGKPFHRYDLDTYMAKTKGFYNSIDNLLSFENMYALLTLALVAAAAVFIYKLKRSGGRRGFLKYACFGFVCIELFVFSLFAKGIRPELASFDSVRPGERVIFETLQQDRTLFRICPFGNFEDTPLWLRPSMNALYGIDSVSIYSPLVNRDYFLEMKGLGTVDDSIGIFPPREKVLYEKLELLRRLNVKYVISMSPLDSPDLIPTADENGKYLYRLTGYFSRFRFSKDVGGDAPAEADIDVVSYGSGYAELEVTSGGEGFLVFAEKFYPGWQVRVDGRPAEILRSSGLIQAVELSPGRHTVVFEYKPPYLNILMVFSAIVFAAVIFAALLAGLTRGSKRTDI